MKTLIPLLFLLTTRAFCQHIEPVNCNQVGPTDWSLYEDYLASRGMITSQIRENDANIRTVTPLSRSYEYVVDEIFLRWTLADTSIAYSVRVADIMDTELLKNDVPKCAIKVYPDSIMKQHNSEILILTIERKNRDGFNMGLNYVLNPMAQEKRIPIRNQMRACANFECQLKVLLDKDLFIDALSFIEGTIERYPSDTDYLQKMYWKVANEAFIKKK